MNWNGWPIHRVLFLFVGVSFFMIFLQVTLYHYRQNFRHWSMWIPVLATPIFGLISIVISFYNFESFRYIFKILMYVGLVAGLFGSFMHIKGVGERVGGYALRNYMVGPPLTLPGMVTAQSLLGLIVLYWG